MQMPPKWVWTCIPPSNVSSLWNIERSATKDITSFSVKFKQLVSFAALQLKTHNSLAIPANQLSTLPPLNHLVHLRLLYLGNNYLTSLTWLWHPNTLTHLDVTGNNIASLAGVDACRSCLHVLNVSENKLVSLDGVQHLLQYVASVVLGLPNLDDVSFVNNPVADCDLYRMRLCQHPRLRVLDHKTVRCRI
ncbi:hypothetical protein DYB31_007617 [Aphanomyces astaci]|uniref:Leucine-rich repeat-containing protein 51 n=1 Tax=Aphanomyces astaci TaxID=112090 RepID=A0A397FCF9_APHAT|nr:hypothetical protein DYB31_007617 [Aphanomyces astaci]